MHITFIFPREVPYDSQSVRQQPCGGTEKTVIFLGEAFQRLGHDVTWITTLEQLQNDTYTQPPDMVVTQEAELLTLEAFKHAKKVWWTHHKADQPIIRRSAAFGRGFADKVVTLSRYHHDDFVENLRIPSVIIGHGVWLDEIQHGERDPYRLIYASTPYRGLARVPALFKQIKAAEPRATLAICSSMKTYGADQDDGPYQALFEELAALDGVELLGPLNQAALYAQYAQASYFYYPCDWPETYCLALDESLAHGCKPDVPNIGALHERLGLTPKDWSEIAQQWQKLVLQQ